MSKPFYINDLRVASPCSVRWETMTGDRRIRHCHSCKLNIYNIAEMTKSEVEDLIMNREDRVCIRLYKRTDGTVLTKDCPVGFRAYQKRVARFAGAALATILGLFSVSFGQKEDKKSVDASNVKIVRTVDQTLGSVLKGNLIDPNGAVVPDAELKLYKRGDKKPSKSVSDADGKYLFKNVSAGTYTLEAKYQGFITYKVVNLEVETGEEISFDIELKPKSTTITVGIYAREPLIDTSSSSIKTKITREMIDKLPY